MKTEHRKKILIVDDERVTRAVLQHDIVLAGFDVIMASNGQEAMKKIREAVPDLIVVDLMMPDMNGFEMCRKIRGYEGTKKTPVIVVSALQSTSDQEDAKTSGADLYLTKPVKADEFVAHIKKFLGSPFKSAS
jgi:DNA-binding response OmpR family regulator